MIKNGYARLSRRHTLQGLALATASLATLALAQAQDEHWSRQFKKPSSNTKMAPDTGMSDGGGKPRIKTVQYHNGRLWMAGAWEPGISAINPSQRRPNEYWHLWTYSEDSGWEAMAWFHSAQGGSGPDGVINDFLWLPDGRLVVGGEFTRLDNPGGTRFHRVNALGIYDPKEPTADKWRPLGNFQYNGTCSEGGVIKCLAYDKVGDSLYIGGTFGGMPGKIPGEINDIPILSRFIHRYDFKTQSYEPLPPGVGGQKPSVNKIIVDNRSSPATIYVAGKFHFTGGNGLSLDVSASTSKYSTGFAKWQEGKGWTAFPDDFPRDGSRGGDKGILDRAADYMFFDSVNVHDALLDGDDIWIVGSFSQGEGQAPLRGIAKWDAAKKVWIDPTGKGGVGRECFSIAKAANGKLYFSGAFGGRSGKDAFFKGFVNGEPAPLVTSFDPKSGQWAPLGSGLSARVFPETHLCTNGDDVYVVGDFDYIGAERTGKDKKADTPFESALIARWNESIDFTKSPPKLGTQALTSSLIPPMPTKSLSSEHGHWSRAFPKPPRAVGGKSQMSAKTGMDLGTGTPEITGIVKLGEALYFCGSWQANINDRWFVWKQDPKEGWVRLAWQSKGGEVVGPGSPPSGLKLHDGKIWAHGTISNFKGVAVLDPASKEWSPLKGRFNGKEVIGHGTEQGGGTIEDMAWDDKSGDLYLVGTAGCVEHIGGQYPKDVGQVIRVDKSGEYHPMGFMLSPEVPSKPVIKFSAIALDKTQDPVGIYIGGTFNYYGPKPTTNKRMAYNIARWDYAEKDWRPVGEGITLGLSPVDAPSYPKGLPGLPECPGRYQGFIGSGFPWIRCLAVDDKGNLYAGGTLGIVDNTLPIHKRQETFGIARWNKSTNRWESPTKVGGLCRDVVQMSWLDSGRLLLTGSFVHDNAWRTFNNVAVLDTASGELSELGGGLMREGQTHVIGSEVVHWVEGDDIYFAGLFDHAGVNANSLTDAPNESTCVAHWNGKKIMDPNAGLKLGAVPSIPTPKGLSSTALKIDLSASVAEGTIQWFERRTDGQFTLKGTGPKYSASVRVKAGDPAPVIYVSVKLPSGVEGGKQPIVIPFAP